ncbi:MAG: hypothetical protein HY568_04245 [Candidatus Latescibacteria bacterium]|nr:hypothetical protein [Candidatus Latescibacterota bacterium]
MDSSWIGDPNRYGYDNNWSQALQNYVDLTDAASPVMLSFVHHLNIEPGFDGAELQVLDPDESWVSIAYFSGAVPSQQGDPCAYYSVQIPDSIIAKFNPVQFRFLLTTDIQGSSADGIYPGDGWSVDSVSVVAGLSDLRFFDDFETGIGTWTVSTFPAVGDKWRIQANVPTEQLCSTNPSKVWTVTNPVTGSLTPRMDNRLITPPIFANRADQVLLTFDVYRNLPILSCFYYTLQFRTRNAGDAGWTAWIPTSSQVHYGTEREWLKQTVPLLGAGGKDSVQVLFNVKDYSAIYCGGVSTSGGTVVYFDNVAVGVIGLAPPTLVVSDQDLYQDTFRTTAFFADDNFNTPRGDSVSVRLSASRGLKSAALVYSVNGGSFSSVPLVAYGSAIPTAYSGDVPAGSYPRGTELRYYVSVTDSLDAVVTLPPDALSASHYYTATVLPAIQAASQTCSGDVAPILYVDSYGGPDGGSPTDQSLVALGARYDRYDVNAPDGLLGNGLGGAPAGDPVLWWPPTSAATLGAYSGILWDVGDRSAATLSAADQALLQQWLALPGSNRGLMMAGDNLAFDMTANGRDIGTFLSCTMGATYFRDIWENVPQDSLSPSTAGAAGTRIASEPFPIDGECPGVNRFDALLTSACAGSKARSWILYPNTLVGAVERRDSVGVVADTSRSVLLGFSLGAMPNTVRRNLLLYRTLVEEFEIPTCYVATAMENSRDAAPAARPVLYDAAPNPFNPFTSIRFSLSRPAHVRLFVFDVSGARVRSLADAPMPPGLHRLTWDGRDDRGRSAASGAYFYRLEADGVTEAKKLILLR